MSSVWGIVFYIRNIILLGLTTKKSHPLADQGFSVLEFEGFSYTTLTHLQIRALVFWNLRVFHIQR